MNRAAKDPLLIFWPEINTGQLLKSWTLAVNGLLDSGRAQDAQCPCGQGLFVSSQIR